MHAQYYMGGANFTDVLLDTSDTGAMSGVPSSPGLIAPALIAVGHVYRVS